MLINAQNPLLGQEVSGLRLLMIELTDSEKVRVLANLKDYGVV